MRQQWERQGVGNLEAVELGLREALFKDARQILQQMLSQADLPLPEAQRQIGEKSHPDRPKQVLTLFGSIQLERDYYYNPATGQGRVPLDQALGLTDGYSPGVVRLASRVAARHGYEAASTDLAALAAISIEGRQIQRIVNQLGPKVAQELQVQPAVDSGPPILVMYIEVDATGVPMVPEELAGRKGKQPDGSAKTREVKLCCVFLQTKTDEEGNPMRDYQSTTYVGGFQTAPEFGLQVRAEAQRRGVGRAKRVVFIGDGAPWIWEVARVNFPGAILILDIWHALEHLHALCVGLYGKQGMWAGRMKQRWQEKFENDQVTEVIAAAHRRLEQMKKLSVETRENLRKQIGYFESNQERMKYGTYRKMGLFYGSGVVEAGCKTVIGQRLKQSGMFWTQTGAESVLALRCALMGNRWDECWDKINQSNYLKIRVAA